MLIITFLMVIEISYIYSPLHNASNFPRFNLYESFSDKKLILKLYMYSPSGPEFIMVDFIKEMNYFDREKKHSIWSKRMYFKKSKEIRGYSNIIFSTNSTEFLYFTLRIRVLLPTFGKPMSMIFYTFEKGFKFNEFLLVDENENFAIPVTIKQSKSEFIEHLIVDEEEANNYLKALRPLNERICIVYENNPEIVITPLWDPLNKPGYITNIWVEIEYKNVKIQKQKYNSNKRKHDYHELNLFPEIREEYYQYAAFECTIPRGYIILPTVFITKEYFQITFFVNYIMFNKENKRAFNHTYLLKDNLVISTLNNNLLIEENINKLFLIKPEEITCPNLSKSTVLKLQEKQMNIYVEDKVKRSQRVKYSPQEMCEK